MNRIQYLNSSEGETKNSNSFSKSFIKIFNAFNDLTNGFP